MLILAWGTFILLYIHWRRRNCKHQQRAVRKKKENKTFGGCCTCQQHIVSTLQRRQLKITRGSSSGNPVPTKTLRILENIATVLLFQYIYIFFYVILVKSLLFWLNICHRSFVIDCEWIFFIIRLYIKERIQVDSCENFHGCFKDLRVNFVLLTRRGQVCIDNILQQRCFYSFAGERLFGNKIGKQSTTRLTERDARAVGSIPLPPARVINTSRSCVAAAPPALL